MNFVVGTKDESLKYRLNKLPVTLFCVHGNHEKRPESIESYQIVDWHGGKVYMEEKYPSIRFAKDGEVYDIAGKRTLVIGGAYSVDKYYRLSRGLPWFPDEQPSEETWASGEYRIIFRRGKKLLEI